MSYLDSTGLAHFWSKIKSTFLAKSKIKHIEKTFTNINITVGGGFAQLGNIRTDFGVPNTSDIIVLGAMIRGWSGATGALSIIFSANGENVYLMISDAPSKVDSVSVRLWYLDMG